MYNFILIHTCIQKKNKTIKKTSKGKKKRKKQQRKHELRSSQTVREKKKHNMFEFHNLILTLFLPMLNDIFKRIRFMFFYL